MNDTLVNNILENWLYVLPVFHKKLHPMDLGVVTGSLTRAHFAVTGILSEGDKTVSELGRILLITKPQMTRIIDQLVEKNIVQRNPDPSDRRVIVLSLTAEGRHFSNELMRKIMENTKKKLSFLTQKELEDMAEALETLRKIGEKL